MKLAHIHVYCQELEPVIAFFTEGLNGELLGRNLLRGAPGAEIRMDGMMIFLREMGGEWAEQDYAGKVCGYNHLGFFVDDLDATLARLLSLPGVSRNGEPFVIADKKLRCVFLTGPSKLHVELMENMQ
ncbi:MAG: VOC family protein [Desulfovibrionaceae bacterium]|nr:VOC family protein [Desulfovibrionaceae bacterium]